MGWWEGDNPKSVGKEWNSRRTCVSLLRLPEREKTSFRKKKFYRSGAGETVSKGKRVLLTVATSNEPNESATINPKKAKRFFFFFFFFFFFKFQNGSKSTLFWHYSSGYGCHLAWTSLIPWTNRLILLYLLISLDFFNTLWLSQTVDFCESDPTNKNTSTSWWILVFWWVFWHANLGGYLMNSIFSYRPINPKIYLVHHWPISNIESKYFPFPLQDFISRFFLV